jgi:heme-degrading monooxygenase HmoA
MPYTVTRQTVGDYPKWRRAFEDNADARGEAGSRGGHIFRNDADRDEVVVFLAWEDLDDARDYLEGEATEEERDAGEVEGRETLYLEELGRPNK